MTAVRRGWILGLILIAELAAPSAMSAQAEVEAHVEPEPVSIEEAARLVIQIRLPGGQPQTTDVQFELENLENLDLTRSSEMFRMTGNGSVYEMRLIYFLRPLSAGPAAVRSIRVQINQDVYELPPQRIEVVNDPPRQGRQSRVLPQPRSRYPDPWTSRRPRARPSPPSQPKIFLRASVTPEKPLPGQQVLFRLERYTQTEIQPLLYEEFPTFRGFWVQSFSREPYEPEVVTVDGEIYSRRVLLEQILVPRRAGTYELEPAVMNLAARLVEHRSLGLTTVRTKALQRSSNPVSVEVRELPPAPEDFSGAVGHLEVRAELGSPEMAAGESTSLSVTYEGTAHLPSLPAPELGSIPGLEVFPPEESTTTEIVGDHLHFTRTWVFTLAPRGPGRFDLGSFRVPFYDTRQGEYRVASSEPVTLTVRDASGTDIQIAQNTGALHSIRSAAVPRNRLPLERALPWLFLVPMGLALVLRWNGRSRRGQAPQLGDDADPLKRLRRQLSQLTEPNAGETDRGTAQTVEEAWRDFLAERWGVSPALPASRWVENLEERRDLIPDGRLLDSKTLAALDEVVREIRYLRHAPQLSDTASVKRELARRSQRLLRRLS